MRETAYLSISKEAPSIVVEALKAQLSNFKVEFNSYQRGLITPQNADVTLVVLPDRFYDANGSLIKSNHDIVKGVVGRGIYDEVNDSNEVYFVGLMGGNVVLLRYDEVIDDLTHSPKYTDYKLWADLKIYSDTLIHLNRIFTIGDKKYTSATAPQSDYKVNYTTNYKLRRSKFV